MLVPGSLPVRLTLKERDSIREGVETVFEGLDITCQEISLFGSRTRMDAKGGDIDLYVRFSASPATLKKWDELSLKAKLKIALDDRLGEQKIDIVLDNMQKDLGAFGKLIQEQKVELWKKI